MSDNTREFILRHLYPRMIVVVLDAVVNPAGVAALSAAEYPAVVVGQAVARLAVDRC